MLVLIMAKNVKRKQSSASLQKEIARLKKLKKEAVERKKLFLARAKEIEEIRELRREARTLKGVGTKRRIAGQVGRRLGSQAGKAGWKGAKFVGNVIKARLEDEAREQARDAARARAKPKPKPKAKPRKKKR